MRTGVIIAQSRHWIVSQDTVGGAVRLTRTGWPYETLAEMDAVFASVHAAQDRLGRAGRMLLVDLRESPLRNDPEYEQAFAKHRLAMIAGYERVAVLIRTEVGRLQVLRHAREDGSDVRVFYDEWAALDHLDVTLDEAEAG